MLYLSTIALSYCSVLYSRDEIPHASRKPPQDLVESIDAGELTGLRLAERTGFKQAHISNFLNRKRGLSLEGMDKVLNVQHLSVLDLIDPVEVNKRASILPPSEDEFDDVVVADPHIAATQPLIMSMHVKEILKFKKSFLKRLQEDVEGDRKGWERFVIIKGNEHVSPHDARRHPAARPPL
jgi:hypothetical protein